MYVYSKEDIFIIKKMFGWAPYPFIRITFALIAGIFLYKFYALPYEHVFYVLTAACLLYVASVLLFNNIIISRLKVIFGLLGLSAIILIGYLRSHQITESNESNHLLNHTSEINYFHGKIISTADQSEKYNRFVMEISKIRNQEAWIEKSGKIHLYVPKTNQQTVKYGDVVLVKGTPIEVQKPLNPEEFNYQQYLAHQNIYFQAFVRASTDFIIIKSQPHPLMATAFKIRNYCQDVFEKYLQEKQVIGIAQALVLGAKDDLDNEVKRAYSAAGVIHVLAVSGLHVGIIFGLIYILFGHLNRTPWGKWLYTFIAIALLIFYSIITGLSPSVMRATVMLVFIIIVKSVNRQSNTYNILAISAFCILLYDPHQLFAVGFQMSYLAVLGIVYLQPKIYQLFVTKYDWVNKIMALLAVSIAAQIATLPLSIYYFHQIPTLSLLINLIMVPAAGVILYLGLALIAVSFFHLAAVAVGKLIFWIISGLNALVFAVFEFSFSHISQLYLSSLQMMIIYSLIIICLAFFHFKKFSYLWWATALVFLLCFDVVYKNHRSAKQKTVVFYNVPGQTMIEFVDGFQGELLVSDASKLDSNAVSFHVSPFNIRHKINFETGEWSTVRGLKLKVFQGKTFCLINQDYIRPDWSGDKVKVNYLIISDNAIRKLDAITQYIAFDELIISTSNFNSVAEDLAAQAREINCSHYSISEEGYREIAL